MRKIILLILTIVGGFFFVGQTAQSAVTWSAQPTHRQALNNHFRDMTISFYADNHYAHISVRAYHSLPNYYRIAVGTNSYRCQVEKVHQVGKKRVVPVNLVVTDHRRKRQIYLRRAGVIYNQRRPRIELVIPLKKLNQSLNQSAIMKLTVPGNTNHVITTVGLSTAPLLLSLSAAGFAGLGLILGRDRHV